MSRLLRRLPYALVVLFVVSLSIVASPPRPAAAADFGAAYSYAFGAYPNGLVVNSVNLGTGSLTLSATDLALPGRLLGFAFTRWYNSADTRTSPLGPGWTHSYNWSMTVLNANGDVELRRGDGSRDTYVWVPPERIPPADGGGTIPGYWVQPVGTFATFVKNADGSYTLTQTNQTVYAFDASGKLVSISEPAGNRLSFAYTGANLTQITDSVGRVITLSYDAQNRLSALSDPLGRKVTYAYDAAGRLVTVTDKIGNAAGQNPLLHQWQYAYDAAGHLASLTDPDGRVPMANTYDASGRVTSQKDGLANTTSFDYSLFPTIGVTDPRGHLVTYTVDTFSGRPTLFPTYRSDTAGGITSTTNYTYGGWLLYSVNVGAAWTTYGHDGRGNLTSKRDPLNYVTSYSYDSQNNLIGVTDPNGVPSSYQYDAKNELTFATTTWYVTTTSTVSVTTSYNYGDLANPGLATRVVPPNCYAGQICGTALAYDAQGNLVASTDPDGNKTTYGYDGVGRRLSTVDADGNATGGIPSQHTWSTAYDQNDRPTSETDPLGHVRRYAYDGAGHRTALTDRNGNLTTFAYDATGRLASVSQPGGLSTSVQRDANGSPTKIVQANNVVTDYGYDEHNLLTSLTTHPTTTSSLTTTYARNANGDPTRKTSADGNTITYGYDADGRLTQLSATGVTVSYTYDPVGRRTADHLVVGTTQDETITYSYDGIGRLLSASRPAPPPERCPPVSCGLGPGALVEGQSISYGYDADSNLTSINYPTAQVVNYAYTRADRLSQVSDWAGRTTSYAYTPSGRVKSMALPNTIAAAFGYDAAQRTSAITYSYGGIIVTDHAYTRDAEGNPTALDEYLGGITAPGSRDHFALSYDALNRLTAVSGTGESFALDGASNLSSSVTPAASYAYDGSNRLTNDATSGYVWTAADQLAQKGTQAYAYDSRGLMTSPGAVQYDADAHMERLTIGASQIGFIWDIRRSPPAVLQTVAGGLTTSYVYGAGPLYFEGASPFSVLAQDALGSVRAEIHADGSAKTFRYRSYGALGQASPAGSLPTLLGFAGRPYVRGLGASDLIFMPARWYDPSVGRFTSRDPSHGLPETPLSLNGFNYANGNPLARLDPTGFAATVSEQDEGSSGGCTRVSTCGNFARPVIDAVLNEADAAAAATKSSNPLIAATGYIEIAAAGVFVVASSVAVVAVAAPAAPEVGAGSALAEASQAAFRAAGAAGTFQVGAKHLADAAGGWSKFAADSNPQGLISEALSSPNAMFLPDRLPGRFQVITDMGTVIGTTGQTALKVVLDFSGRIITSYPVR